MPKAELSAPAVSASRIRRMPGALLLTVCASLGMTVWLGMSGCASLAEPDAIDRRITADVKGRVAQYAELQAPNSLEVQTLHRVVYLRGLMGTPFQISLAGSVAGQVSGVRRVENLIGLQDSR